MYIVNDRKFSFLWEGLDHIEKEYNYTKVQQKLYGRDDSSKDELIAICDEGQVFFTDAWSKEAMQAWFNES